MKFTNIFDALEDSARPVVMAELGIGEVCPACRAPLSNRVRHAFLAGKRIICTPCGWRGSWRDGTPLDRSRLSASQFMFLSLLIQHQPDNRRIAEFIGCDHGTVSAWRQRLAGGANV